MQILVKPPFSLFGNVPQFDLGLEVVELSLDLADTRVASLTQPCFPSPCSEHGKQQETGDQSWVLSENINI